MASFRVVVDDWTTFFPAAYEKMKMMTAKTISSSVANDVRWQRIVARDKTADGTLWYSVSTTGVYCRPSCPSRVANPINVQLHDTLEEARATGFRPCKRCNPDGPSIEAEHAALGADSHGKSRGDAHGVYHCGPPTGLRRQSAHSLKLSHIKGLAVDLEIDSQLTCCELYPLPDKPYFLGA